MVPKILNIFIAKDDALKVSNILAVRKYQLNALSFLIFDFVTLYVLF